MAQTSSWTKDPAARLDYEIDWTTWLDGDTLTASTWVSDSGLTVASSSYDDSKATVWLTGGTLGTRYKVTNHITTAQGRIDERTLTITIRDR